MTHIVLLADCIANLTGGAEKQIYELAKRLDKKKFNVTVISLDCMGEARSEWFTSVGCRYFRFRVVRIYGLSGFLQGLRFYHFLKKEKIDILQTYHFSSDIWGAFWGNLAGVAVIISNRRDMGFWRKPKHVSAYQWVDRWVSKIVVVSNSIRDMVLSTEGVPEDKIEVIYNGVDLPVGLSASVLVDLKNELSIADNELVIMHVASLSPIKGHQFLLEAFQGIIREIKNVKLVLVGEDMLNGSLQVKADHWGIKDHVHFLGERKDIGHLLAIADICVLPSLSEGMSNSILEYMAAAKPVIATNVGGNPELVTDGSNGLLVDKEDVQQLREALLTLIRDKEKRREMGANGLLRVKKEFTMDAMMAHYEQLYKKLRAIRVLHLVSSGGLFGAERVILNLASQNNGSVASWVGAIHNQHNPHLEIIQEAQHTGLKTSVFDSRSQADLKTLSCVHRFLKENRINILHTHNYKSDITGFLSTRFSKAKWASTMHGWTSTDKQLRWYEALDRFVLRFADKIVCVSQNNYDTLLNKGFNKDSLAVIANGVDLKSFASTAVDPNLKKSLGLGPHEIVIAIVGRLGEEKGHKVLLKALSSMLPQFPDLKCLVVGDGPLRMKLQQEAQDLKLSRHIIFTGIRQDMANIYKICDILVNASFTEGLPMTILEAMACGVVVIATGVGAVPQVIRNGENGILIKPGDPEALRQAILGLVKDAAQRKALAQQAHKDVCERFSVQRMAEKYTQLYQGMVK